VATIGRVAGLSDIHGNLPLCTRITPEDDLLHLLEPPTSDETTEHFESLRGA
jgi:hypothetical protein